MKNITIFGINFNEGEFSIKNRSYHLRWNVEKIPFGYIIKGLIKGRPGRIEILRMDLPGKILGGGWQSWSEFRLYDVSKGEIPRTKEKWFFRENPLNEDGIFDYQVIFNGGVAGFLSSRFGHPFFKVEGGELAAFIEYFGANFGDYIPLEPLVVLKSEDTNVTLDMYAYLLKKYNSPNFRKIYKVGWTSWYQYYTNLEWSDVEKNLKQAKSFGVEIFQIDDGYERDIGDWLSVKDGFPSVEEMASEIKKNGYTPGIWLSPFIASESSKVFSSHPDWFAKSDNEPVAIFQNWKKKIYAIDISNEEAVRWVLETLERFKRAGFEFFKLDFLFAAFATLIKEKSISAVVLYRKVMEEIRKVLGNAVILGCGAPLLESAGYVDVMRVGPDTAPYWDCNASDICAKNALRNAITRNFYNGRLWMNDPDSLILREFDSDLTENQRELMAFTSSILNGFVSLSDDFSRCGKKEKELLLNALKFRNGKSSVKNILGNERYEIVSYNTDSGDVFLEVDLKNGEYSIEVKKKINLRKERKFKDRRIFNFYWEE